jgi:metallo-beta-lactamase family protein
MFSPNGANMIKLGFFGAAGEVTGSCYVVTTNRAQVMVDMGMHQGEKEADEHNRRLPPLNLAKLNAVVLTHGHLDHCGRLPMLIKNGYSGAIHCTAATADISGIILRDSAHLQAEDYARALRHRRDNAARREPLYTEQDAERTLTQWSTTGYSERTRIAEGITIEFVDAGHILGAASVQMVVDDGGRQVTIAFSGDIGQLDAPIIRDPITPTPADAVLLESTYGDRDHRSREATCDEFLQILHSAQASRSKVIIPAFALGRAQDLVFHIGEFLRSGKLKPMRAFIDSPMASAVSKVYSHHVDVYDEHATQLLDQHMKPLSFPGLQYTASAEESKELNDAEGPMVIISANGMCTGGRILHHLRHNLPDPNAHIVFVGFQGQGTLGRRLVNGAKFVSIFGRDVAVRAKIHTLGGFSAHAGQSGLLNWAAPFEQRQPRIFLTHGEDMPRAALRSQLQSRFRLESAMPYYGEEVEL